MSHRNGFINRIAHRLATDPHDQAFLYDLIDEPADRATRAIYFDWLAERGDPRGEYAYLRREQVRTGLTPAERTRLDELQRSIQPLWLAFVFNEPVPGTVVRIEDDGFWVDLGGLEGEVHICDCSWC